jgi:hypothetical protein
MDDRVQHEVDKEEDYDPFEDTGTLTQKQANEYLRNGGIKCPYCGSEDIQTTDRDMQAGSVFLEMICDSCNHRWTEGYQLVEIYDEENTQFGYVEELIPFGPEDFLQVDLPSPLSSNPKLDDIEEHE